MNVSNQWFEMGIDLGKNSFHLGGLMIWAGCAEKKKLPVNTYSTPGADAGVSDWDGGVEGFIILGTSNS